MNKILTTLPLIVCLMQSVQAAPIKGDAIEVCACASDVAYTSSRMVHDDVELHEVLKLVNETFKQHSDKSINLYMKKTVINAYHYKNLSPEAMRDMTLTACLEASR